MRLTEYEKETINKLTKKYYGAGAKVYLFGSRVFDDKRGGDIDLLIETDGNADYLNKIKFLAEYERLVNSRKVDLIVRRIERSFENKKRENTNPIFATAKKEVVELC